MFLQNQGDAAEEAPEVMVGAVSLAVRLGLPSGM